MKGDSAMPSTWSQHSLLRLRVRMSEVTSLAQNGPSPGPATLAENVRLELWNGHLQLGEWDVFAPDLKVPRSHEDVALLRQRLEDPAQERSSEGASDARLPEVVAYALQHMLMSNGSSRPLWVEFALPTGFLPFVNWERLLTAVGKNPVLRLPYHPISPVSSVQALEILLCCSGPDSTPLLSQNDAATIVHAIVRGVTPQTCTVHVFSDPVHYPLFSPLQGNVQPLAPVRVYEPPAALKRRAGGDGHDWAGAEHRMQDHPWIAWIRQSLAGRAADVCHFIALADLAGGEAAFQIAETPASQGPRVATLSLTAPYVSGLLDVVGASAAVLSSVGGHVSRIGIRVLCDQIARSRPLTVAGHDLSRDVKDTVTAGRLERVYAFLRTPTAMVPPSGPDLIMYCHPSQVLDEVPAVPLGAAEPLAETLTKARNVAQEMFDSPDVTPAWLAAAHRIVERTVAEYLSVQPGVPVDAAAQAGTRAALELLTSVLADHDRVNDAIRETKTKEAEQ
jgi:hypothetical protein